MPSVDFVRLPDEGVDWLLRPVLRGFCKMESLKDGTIDLADIALMNDMIDIDQENQYRLQRAVEDRRG